MKKYIPILALLLCPFLTQARQVISGLALPESTVAYNNGYFVSNIGEKLEPTTKDGDGAISFIDSTGKLVAFKYFDDTLNAPKGLDIIGHTLYVADIDHLKGYNIITRRLVFDLDLEGKAGMLNDLNAVNDSLLVTTDSFKDDVLLVNLHTASYKVLKGNIVVPNGILYDAQSDRLYVCSMGPGMDGTGKLFTKKLHDDNDAFKPVKGSPEGLFDGIVKLDDHRLLVSDWITMKNPQKGNLYVYDLYKSQYTKVEIVRSPADIALDREKQALLIPRLLDNSLEILPLAKMGL